MGVRSIEMYPKSLIGFFSKNNALAITEHLREAKDMLKKVFKVTNYCIALVWQFIT